MTHELQTLREQNRNMLQALQAIATADHSAKICFEKGKCPSRIARDVISGIVKRVGKKANS